MNKEQELLSGVEETQHQALPNFEEDEDTRTMEENQRKNMKTARNQRKNTKRGRNQRKNTKMGWSHLSSLFSVCRNGEELNGSLETLCEVAELEDSRGNEVFSATNNNLKKSYSNAQIKIKHLTDENEVLRDENKNIIARNLMLKEKLKKVEEEEKSESLKFLLEIKEKEHLSDETEILRDENENIIARNLMLKKKLKKVGKEKKSESLKYLLEVKEKERLSEENEILRDENKNIIARNLILKEKLKKVEKEKQSESLKFQLIIKGKDGKMEEMRIAIDKLQCERNRLQFEKDKLQIERNLLQTEEDDPEDQAHELIVQKVTQEKEKESSKVVNLMLKEKLEKVEKEKKSESLKFRLKIKKKDEKMEEMRMAIDKLQCERNRLQFEKDKLQIERDLMQTEDDAEDQAQELIYQTSLEEEPLRFVPLQTSIMQKLEKKGRKEKVSTERGRKRKMDSPVQVIYDLEDARELEPEKPQKKKKPVVPSESMAAQYLEEDQNKLKFICEHENPM